ncbi:unnamed protein product [Arctia plantaginis]|uniref:Uncharacterized protein n=1 Tax=Arctia plantaginis TaxID=874455 RepID=A0A8S0Z260_ARCPL|nr:unnamed protein product [Arctia plantaginis]
MLVTGLFILSVLCGQNVSYGKKLFCGIEDSDCLTNIAKYTYDDMVNGCLKGVPSSDPLIVDMIEGRLPTMKYFLYNVTFSGLGNCIPELMKFNKNDSTLVYNIACKHLLVEGQYDVQGRLDSMFVRGKGGYIKNYYDYAFLFTLEFDQYFDKNEKLHIHIKNYNFNIDPRGKLEYNFKNMLIGDSEKSLAFGNFSDKNLEVIDRVARVPAMKQIVKLYIKNINTYLKVVPVENILSHKN